MSHQLTYISAISYIYIYIYIYVCISGIFVMQQDWHSDSTQAENDYI